MQQVDFSLRRTLDQAGVFQRLERAGGAVGRHQYLLNHDLHPPGSMIEWSMVLD
jgi:hypothetical protein